MSAVSTTDKPTARHPNYGILSSLNVDEAIAEIASGTLSKTIAARYGVNPKTLRDHLKRHNPQAYAAAVIDQAESMVEDATEYGLNCSDKDDAPIARVRVDAAHKWAAARDPAKWGAKQQITLDARSTVEVVLSDDARSLLDSLRTVASMPIDAPHTELLPAPTGSGDT